VTASGQTLWSGERRRHEIGKTLARRLVLSLYDQLTARGADVATATLCRWVSRTLSQKPSGMMIPTGAVVLEMKRADNA